ncbi:FixH family protein [Brevibacillus choshinensis]|uniref:FixH family protein n=1 Tax=Brevibacillus choshinensis TaxID=54911 RepID=UPI002E241600|nr:FixH family protein [Brevibacillus choshinensis]
MNNIVSRSLALVLFVWMLIIPSAKADVETGWYITGISYEKPFITGTKSVFYVGVVDAKTKSGQMGALDSTSPVTDAVVSAVFLKDQAKKDVILTHDQNGEYMGEVLLPESGEWKVSIKATDDHHETELSTAVKVTETETKGSPFLMILLGVATVAVVIFILKSKLAR